jgi:hypothetical protein
MSRKARVTQPTEEQPKKKAYRAPELVAWGTITDLTRGGLFGNDDGDFTGTSPTL